MKAFIPARSWHLWISVLAFLSVSQAAKATSQTWQATVGAQSENGATQVMGFLPNELWIHAGDNITWTTKSGENHTVTFLTTGQNRPSVAQGCAVIPAAPNVPALPSTTTGESAVTPSGSSYDPAAAAGADTGADTDNEPCVNSGPICDRALQVMPDPTKCPNMPALTCTVKFPTPGNFKFVCLIHRDMTGVVHVLSTSTALPHNDPVFYQDEAAAQARDILSDNDHVRDNQQPEDSSRNSVITTGELVATGGGKLYQAVFRFLPETIYVRVGDTVEWTNVDPTEPHTVTFNPAGPSDPDGNPPPLTGVSDPDNDNDLHGTLPNTTKCAAADTVANCFNSGNIGPALQDQTNQPQPAPGKTRVKVTFTQPGEFDYYCTIHVALGMVGKVIVNP